MTKRKTFRNRKAFYLALGELVHRFNDLELWLVTTLSLVLDIHPGLAIGICAGEGFDRMVKVIRTIALLRLADEDSRTECDRIVKRLLEINQRRNQYVHTTWMIPDDEVVGIGVKYSKHKKHGLLAHREEIDSQRCLKLIKEIADVKRELLEFVNKNFKWTVQDRPLNAIRLS